MRIPEIVLITLLLGLAAIFTTTEGAAGPYRCYDEEDSCPDWAERGDCRTNPRWMAIYCEKSCGMCGRCFDQHRSCPKWAQRGDCDVNDVWMMRHCKLSCKLCDITQVLGSYMGLG